MTSVNVNLGSWVYPSLERLVSFGLIDSALMSTRPLTRLEAARLFAEAMLSFKYNELDEGLYKTVENLLKKAEKNFKDEFAILEVTGGVKAMSFIKPIDEIDLKYGLLDGEYPVYNNEGIEYGTKNNQFLIFSGKSKFFNTVSIYYQPFFKYYQNLNNEEETEFDLEKGYLKLNISNIEFEIGRDSLWWGPGYHGSLLLSNNAEPISNPRPILLPMILRYFGPFKATLLLSKLEDDRPILDPYLYGLRLNIKPIPSLELGVSHIAIFGGEDVSLRLSEITEILYSNQNLTGYKESNQQFSIDLSLWIYNPDKIVPFLSSFKFYTEFGAEDTGTPPDRRAFLFGILCSDLFLTGKVDLRIEYADTSPSSVPTAWYQHTSYPAYYEGRVFGHHVGSDAEDIFIRTTIYLTDNLIAGIDFDAQTQGISRTIQEEHRQFGIDLSYDVSDTFEIKAIYSLDRVGNLNFVSGEDRDYQFTGMELKIRF
jgi:hypothetical protein